jgi:hypothetical protein
MKMKIRLGIAVIGLLVLMLPLAAHAAPAAKQTADVFLWDDVHAQPTSNPPTVVGNASLVRTDDGVSMTFQTTQLPAGDAITIWWIILGPNGPVSGQFAAGHVVGSNGVASFAGHLAVGDTSGCFHPLFPCAGLTDPRHQPILLLARMHGPMDPGRIPIQIHTSEANSLQFQDDLCPAATGQGPFCQIQAALFVPGS